MKRTGKKTSQKRHRRNTSKARWLQNWVAEKISYFTGIPWGQDELIEARRMGHSGVDVVLRGKALELFPFSIECGSGQKINWLNKLRQARKNRKKGTHWLVFMKRAEFRNPVVMMDADVFFELLERSK